MLVDTHCHLTYKTLAPNVDVVLTRAAEGGVARTITVAEDLADARAALELMRTRPTVFLVAGVHPHRASQFEAAHLDELGGFVLGRDLDEDLARRIVGIGETGLDLHYDFSPRDVQERVFRAHLEAAVRLDKPVVIHARNSEQQVCDVLRDYPQLAGRVVFHCFSGDTNLARQALDLGCYLSFTGVVTFKKAADIQSSAQYAPTDRIMLETDAPFLSPEPVRKIKPCEPALLVHTARFVAKLRETEFETLAAETTANAERFFGLTKGTT
jgi:TatD DNase family protein